MEYYNYYMFIITIFTQYWRVYYYFLLNSRSPAKLETIRRRIPGFILSLLVLLLLLLLLTLLLLLLLLILLLLLLLLLQLLFSIINLKQVKIGELKPHLSDTTYASPPPPEPPPLSDTCFSSILL